MKVSAIVLSAIAACLVLLEPASTGASDISGIYTIVDRIVLEPNDQDPQRIQLWGVFATGVFGSDRDIKNPKRGYLYFALPVSQHLAARREWADFKRIAGTGQAVIFGRASSANVRSASETPRSPDVYPLSWGIQKVTATNIVNGLRKARE